MTPKPEPPRPEDESERASPAAVSQADGSPSRADREPDGPGAGAESPLTDHDAADSLSPTGRSPASKDGAVRRQGRDDNALTEAITPLVTDALLVSVRQNPRVLVDALFPIILPAIRRAVAGMLRGLVQSLNQIVEQSLTVRGLRWRWEAWRTGQPVGEIALRDSLVYRVEQALLIHAENGILLQSAGEGTAADPDLMSALLTAIRDFGRESFGEDGEGDFPELPAGGGRQVLVEQGPQAVVAVIVRGTPAAKLREAMQESLGEIQRWYTGQLIDFDGDTSGFEGCKTYLEQCLESEYRRQKQSLTPAYLFLGTAAIVVIGVAIWTVWPRWKWGQYIERLRAEPGIAVIDEGRGGGKFRAEILRDPLAADPEIYLFEAGFGPEDAELLVEPILSFHPELVVRRAEQRLHPPDGVHLTIEQGTLKADGVAPGFWISRFREAATNIPGVERFDDSGLVDESDRILAQIRKQIESREITFEVTEEAVTGQEETLDGWAEDFRWMKSAIGAGFVGSIPTHDARVRIIGQTDETGSERANLSLSRRRASDVASILQSKGIDVSGFEVFGIGEKPIEEDQSTGSAQSMRRVVIRVNFEPKAASNTLK